MNRKIDLTQGEIWKVLIAFAIPLFIGQFLQVLYHSVDAMVVGNFVSSDALASVNASSSISNLLVGFFTGLSAGIGVIFARYIGAKEYDKLHESIQTTVTFTLVAGAVVAITGILFSTQLLQMMNVDNDIIASASEYLRIYMFGVLFTAIYNVGASIVRSTGDSTSPFYYLLISSISNIVLDLLFVAGFHWGVNGVGIATVLAQFVSVFMVFRKLQHLDDRYSLRLDQLTIKTSVLKEVLSLGLPAAIQSSITSVANIFTHRYINGFGKAATAGIPTGQKIDQFAQLTSQALAQSVPTFIAQNIGAKKYDRTLAGVSLSVKLVSVFTVIPGTIIYFIAPQCARIFTDDPAVIEVIVGFLHTVMPFYIFMGLNHVYAGILRGYHKSLASSVCTIFGSVICRQLWLYFSLKADHTIQNLFWCYPIAWGTSALAAIIYYYAVVRKEAQRLNRETTANNL